MPTQHWGLIHEPFDTRGDYPLHEDDADKIGTHADYKAVLLQRLADPAVEYHAIFNPYITVDWKPIDLHVFNGEDNPDRNPAGAD